MKKLVIVFILALVAFFQGSSQPIVLAFTINHSQNFNAGGWFCDLDTITVQDYSTGIGNHWVVYLQDYNYNSIDTIEYWSYQPEIAFAVPHHNTHYRVDFTIYHEDPVLGTTYGAGANVDFRMSYSNGLLINDLVQIPIGDSVVNLTACSNVGISNFTWYKDGSQLKQDMDVYCSQLLASDTGRYIINCSPFGCSAQDTIRVVPGCQLTLNQYNIDITPDSPAVFMASANSPGNFYWVFAGDTVSSTINSMISSFTTDQVGMYILEYANSSGCGDEAYLFVDWLPPTGSVCSMFGTDDSLSLGGGYFCNQTSITFYDLSDLYSTAELYHWTWRVKTGDGNTVLQEIIFNQANYQPSVTIQFADSTAYYRVELAVSSYSPGTSTLNVGLHLGFSNVSASSDVTIIPGDSVTLSASTNYGPGNFLWYKDGNFLGFTSDTNVSYLSVADSGMYLVNYHNSGCGSCDSVMVKWADPMPAPVASFSANSQNYAPVAYFCNTIQVYCYNHSTGSNITKSVWVITQQNQTSTITLTGPNALDFISVYLIPGNDHIDLVKLFVYSFDSNYNVELVDSIETQLVMGFSDIVVNNPVVELAAGSTASLHAYTTFGPGTFIWTNQSGDTLATMDNAIQSSLSVSDTGVYWVKFINVLGNCEDIASVQVVYAVTTNLPELTSDADIQVYPNPSFERFTVDNFSGKAEIFSATGQLIFSQTVSETINVSCQDWKPGFYFIRLTAISGKTETVKLVKKQ